MTPAEAVTYSRRLATSQAPSEADVRVAIHLSYYAAFHFLCARFSVSATTKHSEIRDMLRLQARSASKGPLKRADAIFQSLRASRERADYRWRDAVRKDDATLAVIRAEEILKL